MKEKRCENRLGGVRCARRAGHPTHAVSHCFGITPNNVGVRMLQNGLMSVEPAKWPADIVEYEFESEPTQGFVHCAECSAKPGSPTLCSACLANRSLISDLRREIQEEVDNKAVANFIRFISERTSIADACVDTDVAKAVVKHIHALRSIARTFVDSNSDEPLGGLRKRAQKLLDSVSML